jgi:hypothetical protein
MKLLQKRPWRWLRWLIAGLLSAVVFASLPSIWQSASATTNSNQVAPALQQMDVNPTQLAPLQSTFVDIVATHQEPNFYD